MNSLFKTITSNQNSDDSIVPFEQKSSKQQKIFIKDLELEMLIGVLDQEKKGKQRVIVSAELDVVMGGDWRSDNVANVVSYADIIDIIKIISQQDTHIELVETFAEKIIEECFKIPMVMGASVSVEKPDIIKDTGSVGVIISRQKD